MVKFGSGALVVFGALSLALASGRGPWFVNVSGWRQMWWGLVVAGGLVQGSARFILRLEWGGGTLKKHGKICVE
jgi:hypothetical protein